MTVEAKLKVTPEVADALKSLKAVRAGILGIGEATKQASSEPAFTKTREGLGDISSRLSSMHKQLLAFFGLQQGSEALAGIARMSDNYASMHARLRIVTNGQAEFNTAMAQAKGLAAQYNQPLTETVALYTRVLSAVRPLGGGVREANVATTALVASLKISGASAAESSSAILQFSQALGSGVLRGEEFNAINEAAPRLLDALAAGLGKPKSELKALAEQGQLTTSAVVSALQRELPKLQSEAAKIPPTLGGAFQQVRDAVAQYIGKQTEANGVAATTVGILHLVARNIDLLVASLQVLAAVSMAAIIGRGTAALVAMAAASTSAVTVIGALTWSMRGLLALVGGPLGLVAALASLAAGWTAVEYAKSNARQRTEGDARRELGDLQREVAQLEAAKASKTLDGPGSVRLSELRRNMRFLQSEVDEFDRYNNGAFRGLRQPGGNGLEDPATLKKFQDDYKLRSDIVKKFADERATYLAAKNKEIEAATARGDAAAARKAGADKLGYLKEQKRAESEALKAYDTRDALTRLAQAKQLYDKDFELLADATKREKALVQERFDAGLVDLQSYLAEKARLSQAESQQEVDRLNARLTEERRVLALNEARYKKAKTANDKEQVMESLVQSRQKVAELETEIERKERDRINNNRQLGLEAEKFTRELADQNRQIETQLKQLRGTESDADIARRIQDQFTPQIQKEFQLGGDGSRTQELADATIRKEILAKREREYSRAVSAMRTQEEALRLVQEQGGATAEETEARILELRRQELPTIRALAAELARLAQNPDDKARAAQVKVEIDRLGDQRTELQKSLQNSARQGFGTFFSDILTGAKTAGDALRSMLANFANQMLTLIGQRLGAKLFESFGLGKMVDGIGTFVTSLFGFHSGGVVSAGGASFTRAMPAGMAALAASIAPRYHGGGIAGFKPLKPNERLSVLEDGEEVLTASNPRHIRNQRAGAGGSGMQVQTSVVVNGAGGATQQQESAGLDLSNMINGAIDQWAIKQSRPGGVLAKG